MADNRVFDSITKTEEPKIPTDTEEPEAPTDIEEAETPTDTEEGQSDCGSEDSDQSKDAWKKELRELEMDNHDQLNDWFELCCPDYDLIEVLLKENRKTIHIEEDRRFFRRLRDALKFHVQDLEENYECIHNIIDREVKRVQKLGDEAEERFEEAAADLLRKPFPLPPRAREICANLLRDGHDYLAVTDFVCEVLPILVDKLNSSTEANHTTTEADTEAPSSDGVSPGSKRKITADDDNKESLLTTKSSANEEHAVKKMKRTQPPEAGAPDEGGLLPEPRPAEYPQCADGNRYW
ncbi:hypothetical protein PV08_07096 [Exophiala spinifera]|uniref:Uncharacterized protein n=1 Tax=Exophiala spinifera TaxID=91928 RepID=A0A0D2BSQ7_9EURO|nr:uncharacterized protein PV08_07096 [Exophiala spinifera]KIW14314.1 hypothetical protein PV08_07096 [Exophiala spinifera]